MTITPAKPDGNDTGKPVDVPGWDALAPVIATAAEAHGSYADADDLGRLTAFVSGVLDGDSPAYWFIKLYGRPDR